jgi:excisionase family DNA binding protein
MDGREMMAQEEARSGTEERTLPVDQLIYPRSAAKILGCSKSMVFVLIQRGELEAYRIGLRGVRVSESSVNEYLKKSRIDPGE